MPDRPAASSDADRLALRALARRLRPDADGPAEPAPPRQFVRLAAPPTTAPRDAAVAAPDDVDGSAGWARLVEWCVVELGVEQAVLSDDRGLVIATAGVSEAELADGLAARLVTVFRQADLLASGATPVVHIQLGERWLTALRVSPGPHPLALGLVGLEPLGAAARAAVVAAFSHKAGRR